MVKIDASIQNYYNITFTIGIFFLIVIEHFLKAFGEENPSKIILKWGSLIIIYVLSYIIYDKKKEDIEKDYKKKNIISSILKANLVIIGLTILIMGQLEIIDQWNNIFERLITIAFFTLIWAIGYIIPISLIFIQSHKKRSRYHANKIRKAKQY